MTFATAETIFRDTGHEFGSESASDRKMVIQRSFDAAAGTYDAHAGVQREIAKSLAAQIGRLAVAVPQSVLEIGCGTGFLSEHLRRYFPRSDLVLTDLSPAMVARCRERLGAGPGLRFATMDGEQPSLDGKFDLVASSAAFQWFVDLPRALAALVDRLRPGGRLVFATLGAGTFAEWRRAHERLGSPFAGMEFPAKAELVAMMRNCPGVRVELLEDEPIVHSYADAQSFLHEVRCIGAAVPPASAARYTPGRLRGLMRALDGGEPLAVTYDVLYGALQRPEFE